MMKKLTQEEVNAILEKHKKWLNGEEGGVKADFSHHDVSCLDFSGANCSQASFRCADCFKANFQGADCRWAKFQNADCFKANFQGADCSLANFEGADCFKANFQDANCFEANFKDAYCFLADFQGADCSLANFEGADCFKANFQDADCSRVDFSGANLEGTGLFYQCIAPYIVISIGSDTSIGCKRYQNEEWKAFSDEVISKMDIEALEWWNANKEAVFELMKQAEAYHEKKS